jgi:hypothetical protein
MTAAPCRWWHLFVAASLLAGRADASEEVHRWVLLIETDEPSRLAATLQESVRAAARFRLGLRFLSPEEAFVGGGLEVLSGLSACGADTACLASRLSATGADYALLLVARRVGGANLLALRAVRARSGAVLHRAVSQLPALSAVGAATSSLAATAFAALGYVEGGELIAVADPTEAQLALIEPQGQRGLLPGATTLLPAGRYRLRAELDGFAGAEQQVQIDGGTTQRVELKLIALDRFTDSVWFWLGLGAAATAIGVGIGAAAAGTDRCFCAAPDPAACDGCP